MDADADEATAEDAMDHEFDSTGHKDETSSGSGAEGAPDPGAPLEDPPKGPNSAHFREAARLAAARARKAIEQERSGAKTAATPQESETNVDEKTFATAARKRAMHVSGRDPEESPPPKSKTSGESKSASEQVREDRKRDAKKEISQLDERLMLGARMLRAFESQIQRLDAAASRVELTSETSQPPPPTTAPVPDTSQQEAALEKAEKTIARLEQQIRKATDAADSLANSIEISGALSSERTDWAEQARRSEEHLAQRAESVQTRTQHALESMEQTFRRVMEIERAVMTRIDQAMNRLEQQIDSSTPLVTSSKQAPLIEVEPRQNEPQRAPATKPPPVATPTPEADSLSVGTLSVDTTLRTRRLQGGS
ncbi:MAG: hypothetical protein CBC35_08215 [Planctomycetes bacterium TMED75]|nr:hypothetical protein [Planctomycetaceae bacterium]OUU92064.1 MAG: hypothetical protein CBC35_08215 [Planctomycetes bacterium TMED75]